MKGEILRLELEGKALVGELAVDVPPGTTAAARDKAIVALLGPRLQALANEAGIVVGAAASSFAFPEPGKDEQKRTHFTVRGVIEGDRLIPQRPGQKR